MKSQHAMRIYRGFTLIEMLLTMSVGSVLMVLAMSLLQQVMTLSSQAKGHHETESATNRLCDQFRRDAHSADSVTVDPQQNVLMQVGEQVIHYNFQDHRVRRSVFDHVGKREVRQDERPTHHESYDVGARSELTLETLESPRRVMLTLRRHSPLKHLEARVDRQVSAVVGRLNQDLLISEDQ